MMPTDLEGFEPVRMVVEFRAATVTDDQLAALIAEAEDAARKAATAEAGFRAFLRTAIAAGQKLGMLA